MSETALFSMCDQDDVHALSNLTAASVWDGGSIAVVEIFHSLGSSRTRSKIAAAAVDAVQPAATFHPRKRHDPEQRRLGIGPKNSARKSHHPAAEEGFIWVLRNLETNAGTVSDLGTW